MSLLLIGGVTVFVVAMIVYILFMVFLPEWVGITGKNALDTIESHKDGSAQNDVGIEKFVFEENGEPRRDR